MKKSFLNSSSYVLTTLGMILNGDVVKTTMLVRFSEFSLNMKKNTFFATLFMLFSLKIFGQVIYSENFGVINGQNALIPLALHNGYQNPNVTYTAISFNSSTNTYISAWIPSVGYIGASGGAYVLLEPPSNFAHSSNQFLVEGINTSEYTDIKLTFGYGIPVFSFSGFNYDIIVEVSEDGIQWHQLSFVRDPVLAPPTGGTWQLASPLGTIPSTKNLRLRFSNSAWSGNEEIIYWNRYMLFIDDIILTGTKKNVSNDVFETTSIKIYPNPVTNGILNFQITEATDVNVELFDITGKRVLSGKTVNKSFDVSSLKAGVYFIKTKEFDKLFSQKIIIK